MKKIFMWIVAMFINMALWAGNEKPIKVIEMPVKAQRFIQTFFQLILLLWRKWILNF